MTLPRIALREHTVGDLAGLLDDVVVEDVTTFRAEQLDDGLLWLCCYLRNGERVTFHARAARRGRLELSVGELPGRWRDWDTGEERGEAA